MRAGHALTFEIVGEGAHLDGAEQGADKVIAPMPGLIKIVRAVKGESVTKGQSLLVLEAMKMEHTLAAPREGVIKEIAAEGLQVAEGAVLVRFAEPH